MSTKKKTTIAENLITSAEASVTSSKATKPVVKRIRPKTAKVELVLPKTVAEELIIRMVANEISERKLSLDLNINRHEVRKIIAGGSLSVETAFRLGVYFNTTTIYWIDLHREAELWRLEHVNGITITDSIKPLARSN